MFVYDLPTTRSISYADYFHTLRWSAEVSQATEKRARLQQTLKAVSEQKASSGGGSSNNKSNDTSGTPVLLSQKEWIKVVQSVENYLPYLVSIYNSVKTDDILPKGELFFAWKETLSTSTSKALLPGVQFELLSVLILYGKSLCNFAASIVASLGNYEYTEAATLSDEERKRKEERLKFAADLQCRAAGMFEYVARTITPEWEGMEGIQRLSQMGRTIESTGEMCSALSKLAHAEAELLATRKLLSPCLCYQTAHRTSSPPLATNHPSPSLISKLYLNVATTYDLVLSLSQTASSKTSLPSDPVPHTGASDSSDKQGGSVGRSFGSSLKQKLGSRSSTVKMEQNNVSGKISASFTKYLQKSARNSRARANFWLGVDRGERGQYGEALSFLQMATEELQASTSGKRPVFRQNDKAKEEKRDFARDKEDLLKLIEQFSSSYKQLNDSVAFQPIVGSNQLLSQIPAGRAATTIKTYSLPVPAFGPNSVDFLADKMSSMPPGMATAAHYELKGASNEDSATGPEYAGKGAYY